MALDDLELLGLIEGVEASSGNKDFLSRATQFFINKGYEPHHAAGLAGNLMHESGGKIDIRHDKGIGYGLAGWNGGRLQGLYKFAGTTSPSEEQQLAYVDYELKNSETSAYDKLLKSRDVDEATTAVSNYYERPGKPMLESRKSYGRRALEGIGNFLGPSPAQAADVPNVTKRRTPDDDLLDTLGIEVTKTPTLPGPIKQTDDDSLLETLGIEVAKPAAKPVEPTAPMDVRTSPEVIGADPDQPSLLTQLGDGFKKAFPGWQQQMATPTVPLGGLNLFQRPSELGTGYSKSELPTLDKAPLLPTDIEIPTDTKKSTSSNFITEDQAKTGVFDIQNIQVANRRTRDHLLAQQATKQRSEEALRTGGAFGQWMYDTAPTAGMEVTDINGQPVLAPGKGIAPLVAGTPIAQGALGVAKQATDTMQWMTGGKSGDEASAFIEQRIKGLGPQREDIVSKTLSGLGSSGPFLAAGVGLSAFSVLSNISPLLGRAIAASAPAALEAILNGGGVYGELKAKGWNDEDASWAASKTTLAQLPINIATDFLALGPLFGNKGWFRNYADPGFSNAMQETGQYVSEQWAKRDQMTFGEATENFGIGGVVGLLLGPLGGSAGKFSYGTLFNEIGKNPAGVQALKQQLLNIHNATFPNESVADFDKLDEKLSTNENGILTRLAQHSPEFKGFIKDLIVATTDTLEVHTEQQDIAREIKTVAEGELTPQDTTELQIPGRRRPLRQDPRMFAEEEGRVSNVGIPVRGEAPVVTLVPKEKKAKGKVPISKITKPVVTEKPTVPITKQKEDNIDPSKSAFRQTPDVTKFRAETFDKKKPNTPETMFSYLINQVNQWLDGNAEVSIDNVRSALSQLAVAIDDVKNEAMLLDAFGSTDEANKFRKIIKNGAVWARDTKQNPKEFVKEEEVTPEVEPTLPSKIDESTFDQGLFNAATDAFNTHPLYIEREKLFKEQRKLSESRLPDEQFIPAAKELNAKIDEITKQLYSTPEAKEWGRLNDLRGKEQTKLSFENQRKNDESIKHRWDKEAPQHGTDDLSLVDILNNGLEVGSALDYTPDKAWASEYPIRIVVPSAHKGKFVEHNNYYTSANKSRVAKVIIDLSHYTEEATPRIRNMVMELSQTHSDVYFEIIDPAMTPKVGDKVSYGRSYSDTREAIEYGKVTSITTHAGVDFYKVVNIEGQPSSVPYSRIIGTIIEVKGKELPERAPEPAAPSPRKERVLEKTDTQVNKLLELRKGKKKVEDVIFEESLKKAAEDDVESMNNISVATDAIEKYYGKPMASISDQEIDEWLAKQKGGGVRLYSGIDPGAITWYYHKIRNILNDKKFPPKGTGKAYKTILDAWSKKGIIKADELEYTGVNKFLRENEDKKVSKEQINEAVAELGVKIKTERDEDPDLTLESRLGQTPKKHQIHHFEIPGYTEGYTTHIGSKGVVWAVTTEGKDGTVKVQEIQSDLHRAGEKHGYIAPEYVKELELHSKIKKSISEQYYRYSNDLTTILDETKIRLANLRTELYYTTNLALSEWDVLNIIDKDHTGVARQNIVDLYEIPAVIEIRKNYLKDKAFWNAREADLRGKLEKIDAKYAELDVREKEIKTELYGKTERGKLRAKINEIENKINDIFSEFDSDPEANKLKAEVDRAFKIMDETDRAWRNSGLDADKIVSEKAFDDWDKAQEEYMKLQREYFKGEGKQESYDKLRDEKLLLQAELDKLPIPPEIRLDKVAPDAPFKKTWPELAAKKMLYMAAEKGAPAIEWPTAETAAMIEGLEGKPSKLITIWTSAVKEFMTKEARRLGTEIELAKDKEGHKVLPEKSEEYDDKLSQYRIANEALDRLYVEEILPEVNKKGLTDTFDIDDPWNKYQEGLFSYDEALAKVTEVIGESLGQKFMDAKSTDYFTKKALDEITLRSELDNELVGRYQQESYDAQEALAIFMDKNIPFDLQIDASRIATQWERGDINLEKAELELRKLIGENNALSYLEAFHEVARTEENLNNLRSEAEAKASGAYMNRMPLSPEVRDKILETGFYLFSGLPIHLIPKIFRSALAQFKGTPKVRYEDFEVRQGKQKPDGSYYWHVWGKTFPRGRWTPLDTTFSRKGDARLYANAMKLREEQVLHQAIQEIADSEGGYPNLSQAHQLAIQDDVVANRVMERERALDDEGVRNYIKRKKYQLERALHDDRGPVRRDLTNTFGEDGARLFAHFARLPGGSAYGDAMVQQMIKEMPAMSARESSLLDEYLFLRRLSAIWRYKPDFKARGYTQDRVFNNLDRFTLRHKLSEEEMRTIHEASEVYFAHHRLWVDELVAAGLKSEAEGVLLKDHNYSKLTRVHDLADVYDAKYEVHKPGEKPMKKSDSGVDPLGMGGGTLYEKRWQILATETARRIFARSVNNQTKLALKQFMIDHPDAGLAWFKGLNDTHGNKTKMPERWVREVYFEAGDEGEIKEKALFVHPDVYQQVFTIPSDVSSRATMWLNYGSGANFVRAMAVGTSAAWASTRGLMMDIVHGYFSPRTIEGEKAKGIYSPFFPAYLAQLGANIGHVTYDAYTQGPKFVQYAKYGGMTVPFLSQRTSTETGKKHLPTRWDSFMDDMSYQGRSLETMMRLAIMDRVVGDEAQKLGMDREALWQQESEKHFSDILLKATNTAVEHMPYGQIGWFTRVLDKVTPFLGANYVGNRTFWRAAIERPVDFSLRVTNIAAAAAALTIASLLGGDDRDKDIPNWAKERNATLPYMPDHFNFTDSAGKEWFWYLTVPLTGGPGMFFHLFRGITHKILYEYGLTKTPPPVESVINSIKNLMATSTAFPTSLPPIMQAYWNYVTGYNNWTGEFVTQQMYPHPMSAVEGMENPKVPAWAQHLGQATGLSPVRATNAARALVPSNEITWLTSNAYNLFLSSLPPELKKNSMQEVIAGAPFANTFLKLSYRGAGLSEPRFKEAQEEEVKNLTRSAKFKRLMIEGDAGVKDTDVKVKEFIRGLEKEKEYDLADRFRSESFDRAYLRKSPDRSLWLPMINKSAELQAMDYYRREKIETSPKDQERLREGLNRMRGAGYIREDFDFELGKLRRQNK